MIKLSDKKKLIPRQSVKTLSHKLSTRAIHQFPGLSNSQIQHRPLPRTPGSNIHRTSALGCCSINATLTTFTLNSLIFPHLILPSLPYSLHRAGETRIILSSLLATPSVFSSHLINHQILPIYLQHVSQISSPHSLSTLSRQPPYSKPVVSKVGRSFQSGVWHDENFKILYLLYPLITSF